MRSDRKIERVTIGHQKLGQKRRGHREELGEAVAAATEEEEEENNSKSNHARLVKSMPARQGGRERSMMRSIHQRAYFLLCFRLILYLWPLLLNTSTSQPPLNAFRIRMHARKSCLGNREGGGWREKQTRMLGMFCLVDPRTNSQSSQALHRHPLSTGRSLAAAA